MPTPTHQPLPPLAEKTPGAWYDGWETRRHNPKPYDWVTIRLGPAAGIVHGVEIDTAFFSGNHAEAVSVLGCYEADEGADEMVQEHQYKGWKQLLPRRECGPSQRHAWTINGAQLGKITHVKLCMYPDGGIARFRLYGTAVPIWPSDPSSEIELSAAVMGGVAVACSDQHFGRMSNILLPGRGKDMGDGWETKRSRTEGHRDWVVVRLGARGRVTRVVVDTMHFRGNFPRGVRVEGLDARDLGEEVEEGDERWVEVVGESPCVKDLEHEFGSGVLANVEGRAFTHMKIVIVPDGGVKRFRVFGTKA